ncbi:MAG: glycoside hydrolase family 26 protein [Planctomycetota bacterium]
MHEGVEEPSVTPGVVESGLCASPPTVDGRIRPGEWTEARIVSLEMDYDDIGQNLVETHPVKIYVMNDREELFVGLTLEQEEYDGTWSEELGKVSVDLFMILFDGNDDGIFGRGEDKKFLGLVGGMSIYSDKHNISEEEERQGKEEADERQHGAGAISHSNMKGVGDYTAEFRIPLSSGDAFDINAKPGARVRWNIAVFDKFGSELEKISFGALSDADLENSSGWGYLALAGDPSGQEVSSTEVPSGRSPQQEKADIKTESDLTVTPKGNRLLNIDISPSEELDEVDAFFLTRSRAGINAAVAGGSWPEIETAPGEFNYPGLKSANSIYKDVKVVLELNPIETLIRTVPSDLETVPFDDPVMIARFKKLLDVVFSQLPDLQITALWIGNEVTGYLDKSGEWDAYQTFYETVGAYARTIRPGIKVGSAGSMDDWNNIAKSEFKQAKVLNGTSDIIVFTCYPTPGNVKNAFDTLTSEFASRPIYIKEIGCPTSSRIGSSQETQKEFVKEVFRAWDEHASQIEYLSFHALHDFPEELVTGIFELMEMSEDEDALLNMEIMTSFGLRTYPGRGRDKLGFRELIREARARGWIGEEKESNDISIGQFIIADKPDIDDYNRRIGRPPPIVFYFSNWVLDDDLFKDPENPAPLSLIDIETLNRISDQGSIPAIAWETPVKFLNVDPDLFHLVPNVPRILNGEFDDYIATTARILKEYGKPIMLTMFGEFNNFGEQSFGKDGLGMPGWDGDPDLRGDVDDLVGKYGDPQWPDGPERIRDVFIRIIDIFRKEGADNIIWFMYTGSNWLSKDMDDADAEWWSYPKYYYPGDEYIDWVGKSVHFETFEEFKNLFQPAYDAWGEVTQKPFYIPEFNPKRIDPGRQDSRTPLMKRVFLEYLPTKPRFKAATILDSPIGVQLGFDWVFILGGKKGEHPDEIHFWKEVIVKNPGYSSQFVIERSR